MKNTIGIIGAGNIGKAVAAHVLKNNYTFSSCVSRDFLSNTFNVIDNFALNFATNGLMQ